MLFVFFLFILSVFNFELLKGTQNQYEKGAEIPVKVRKLHSLGNLPYDYYSLPFCAPEGVSVSSRNEAETLGELLFGDRIKRSVYSFKMMENIKCKKIDDIFCKKKFSQEEITKFEDKIKDDYLGQLIVDELPVASLDYGEQLCVYENLPSEGTGENLQYRGIDGYSIGCQNSEATKFALNNHLSFNIKVHKNSEEGETTYSVIAAEVVPASIQHTEDSCLPDKDISEDLSLLVLKFEMEPVVWTYSVNFELVDQSWSTRWDKYKESEDSSIHWFSIVNSCLTALILSAVIAIIMIKTLRRDILKYNIAEEEEELNEKGWKYIHTEVFRPPVAKALFSVLLGTGIQIFGTAIIMIPIGALGILSPSLRGYYVSGAVILFFLMGVGAGFFGLRMYKSFGGERWKLTTVLLGTLLPSIVFVIIFITNLIVYFGAKSTISIPFLNLFLWFLLWVGIYLPLCFIGGFIGFRRKPIEYPCETSKIPRQIPKQSLFMNPLVTILLAGVLPFGAIVIETYFLLTSIWMNKIYFFFGFIFLIFVILLIVTSEITIVFMYMQLCAEDYRWYWRSFFTGASVSIYLLGFSILYYFSLDISSVFLVIVYFGYVILASCILSLLLGSVGYFATLIFMRKIYGSIKFA